MTTSKPIRTLFITRAYGQSAGGMERLSFDLIEEMKHHAGISPIVLAHTTRPGISLTKARMESVLFLVSVFPRAVWSARKVDVIHLGDPVLSKIGWFIQKIYRKPVVVTVHGLDVSYSNWLYKMYLYLFFRSFDAYLPISRHAKACLEAWNVSGEVSVIPPGVRDMYYSPTTTRSDLERVLKRNLTNTVVLGTVGRLVERKGHAWFITNVLTKLPAEYIYCIAGDGPERSHIEDVAREAGVENRVMLLGRTSPQDLAILFNTIDIYIQPNIPIKGDAEGFGIVLLEAALCERHVLASNLEGIPDAISDENNGTLIPSENAEAWIAAITKTTSKGDSNPKARVYTLENLSWKSIGQRYVDVLTKLSSRS